MLRHGETFGPHKREKCLAYALTQEFVQRGWTVTNFAHYLSLHPPTWEVELKLVTAWSCFHGVSRRPDDWGCGSGGGRHQKWRRPLRTALDWLRDLLIEVCEDAGRQLFRNPRLGRDEYIQVIRDRSVENVERFLARHAPAAAVAGSTGRRPAAAGNAARSSSHAALLMYTSCGWFFEEMSRPEGVRILRSAAWALELAGEVAGVQLEKQFVELLAFAPSNVELYKDGAAVYRHLAVTSQAKLNVPEAKETLEPLMDALALASAAVEERRDV